MAIKSAGSPAEESGESKVLLLQRGVFNDMAMAMAMAMPPAPARGGAALSAVPVDASARYHVAAPDLGSLHQWEARVRASFEAGALAAGCAHEVTQVGPVDIQLLAELWFAAAYRGAITGLGAAATDDAQRERLIGTQSRRVPAAGGDQ